MTGTAITEATEFQSIYKLDVVEIPTNKPLVRYEHHDVLYRTQKEKWNAVVEEIVENNEKGRPVLVGTISIENSEYLSSLLRKKGIKHVVLNAKYHEMEANIIAQAGRVGSVTIATNMAGRGVDILLGGNADFLATEQLRKKGVDISKASQDEWEQALADAQNTTQNENKKANVLFTTPLLTCLMSSKQFFLKRYKNLGWKYKNPQLKKTIRINTMNASENTVTSRLKLWE